MMKTDTERARYSASVKGIDDGELMLVCEPLDVHLSILRKGMLALDLKPGTSVAQAQHIAALLNEHTTTVAYTGR